MTKIAAKRDVPELTKVVNFRLAQLLVGGYTFKNAQKLAADMNVDWHQAIELRRRCTDEKLCMKILT